jgi:hypothetical protein
MDTHLLEMKIETSYGFKRWPGAKSKPRCAMSEPNTYYPQKFLLRVVAHLVSQTHFLSASPNLGDEIFFKGGSLSHPKILECENK